MISPAHRAALGFLRGGLISVVSLVLPVALAPVAVAFPGLGSLTGLVRTLIPLCGFAVGGAVGGAVLGFGTRGTAAFAWGGFAAGLVLHITYPELQGLTGFEDPFVVAAYAILASAAAFGLTGVIGSLVVGRGGVLRVTAGFAAAGAVGGLLGVAPFLSRRSLSAFSPDLWLFLTLASTVGSVVVPFAVGGSAAAHVWSEMSDE